jgi:hypothetical protein
MKDLQEIEKKIGAVETILNGIKADVKSLQKTEPEFKVGSWYVREDGGLKQIYRVSKINNFGIWYDNSFPDSGNPKFADQSLSLIHISEPTRL